MPIQQETGVGLGGHRLHGDPGSGQAASPQPVQDPRIAVLGLGLCLGEPAPDQVARIGLRLQDAAGHAPAQTERCCEGLGCERGVGAGETGDELGQGIAVAGFGAHLAGHRHPQGITQQREIRFGGQAFLVGDDHGYQAGRWRIG